MLTLLLEKGEGIDKGAFKPCPFVLLDCWSAAPLYRMNKERPIDDRATLILLLTLPPCHLKGEVAEASLKARPKSDL